MVAACSQRAFGDHQDISAIKRKHRYQVIGDISSAQSSLDSLVKAAAAGFDDICISEKNTSYPIQVDAAF
jgi:hypothetical protein